MVSGLPPLTTAEEGRGGARLLELQSACPFRAQAELRLGARPLEEAWVASLRDQCERAKVPFFFKQWGGRNKKLTGRLLQGRPTWFRRGE